MERGLIWLPLLGLFGWLAWAGWNEYQKLEAYKHWAQDFERAKYDLYAALGQVGDTLVWGRPTRQGPVDLTRVSLAQIRAAAAYGDRDRPLPADATLPRGCRACLRLDRVDGQRWDIPFTDYDLAQQWQDWLRSTLQLAPPQSEQGAS